MATGFLYNAKKSGGANCGTGAGGFKPGNKCAGGSVKKPEALAMAISRGVDEKLFGSREAAQAARAAAGYPEHPSKQIESLPIQQRMKTRDSAEYKKSVEDWNAETSKFKEKMQQEAIGAEIMGPGGKPGKVVEWGYDSSGGDAPVIEYPDGSRTKVNITQFGRLYNIVSNQSGHTIQKRRKRRAQTITANFAGGTRREMLHGRPHIVAPLSLINPGVLNGSRGPLLYPEDELKRNPDAWNHVPIVVYHPTSADGGAISARDPGVLDKQGIGVVLKATYNGKLIAEGWFDIERTRSVDSRVLAALEASNPIELSTGLFTENTPAEGEYNGKAYSFIARNYRPDHLAILPDKPGACSIADGCGVLVNEEGEDDARKKPVHKASHKLLEKSGFQLSHTSYARAGEKSKVGGGKAPDVSEYVKPDSKQTASVDQYGNFKLRSGVEFAKPITGGKGELKDALEAFGKGTGGAGGGNCGIGPGGFQPGNRCAGGGTHNESKKTQMGSFRPVSNAKKSGGANCGTGAGGFKPGNKCGGGGGRLQSTVASSTIAKTAPGVKHKVSATEHTVEYWGTGGDTLSPATLSKITDTARIGGRAAYDIRTESGVKSVRGSVKEIKPSGVVLRREGKDYSVDYEKDAVIKVLIGNQDNQETRMALKPAQRTQIIDRLIANCSCEGKPLKTPKAWDEDDREGLESLSDEKLEALDEGRKALAKNSLTGNAAPEQLTDEQWMRSAPPSLQRLVSNAQAFDAREKARLINVIVANGKHGKPKEYWEKFDIEQLEPIAAMAAETAIPQHSPNYYGSAGGGIPANNEQFGDDSDMDSPTINWTENARK